MERTMKTLRFPEKLLEEMQPLMKKEKLNFTSFVMEAVKNYIHILKYREGVKSSFAAWSKNEHPELKNGSSQYIRKMRKGRAHDH